MNTRRLPSSAPDPGSSALQPDRQFAFELAEYEERAVEVPASVARSLARSRLVAVSQRPGERLILVKASSLVGIEISNDWEVRVRPKLPISNLMHLLGFSSDDGWRDETATGDNADLEAILARAFSVHAAAAIERGLLHDYVAVNDDLATVRGRINYPRQLSRRMGLAPPIAVRYDEFSPVTRENHLLRLAVDVLIRLPGIGVADRARLRRIDARLVDVPLDAFALPLMPHSSRLNRHYGRALELAWAIVNMRSPADRSGHLPSLCFAFDMNRVFEEFVGRSLRRALSGQGVVLRFRSDETSARMVSLDSGGGILMKPDITVLRRGLPIAVADAKYKDSNTQGDFYQALAYAVALGIPRAHLILATDDGSTSTTFRAPGRDLIVNRIDLAARPEDIATRVAEISRQMVRD